MNPSVDFGRIEECKYFLIRKNLALASLSKMFFFLRGVSSILRGGVLMILVAFLKLPPMFFQKGGHKLPMAFKQELPGGFGSQR